MNDVYRKEDYIKLAKLLNSRIFKSVELEIETGEADKDWDYIHQLSPWFAQLHPKKLGSSAATVRQTDRTK